MFQNPLEQINPHAKGNSLFAEVHGNEHFSCIGSHGVNCISKDEGKVKVRDEIYHGDAGKVTYPVEVVLGGETVEDEAGGSDEAHREKDPETHFCFADGGVAGSEVSGYAVGGRGKGDGEGVADYIS
jgi:hypothetical protein